MGGKETVLASVPYDRLALVYDAIPPGQAYQSVLQQALEVFSCHANIKSIVDLACGTGSATISLSAMGYQVTGLDLSPGMIDAARRKAQAAGEAPLFKVDDMRTFRLEESVDAVVCFGDAANHLLEEKDLRSWLFSVKTALRPGGLLVFDVNTLCGLKEWDGETYVLHNEDFAYICECVLLEDVMTVNATFFLPQPEPPHFYRHHETFWERAWPLAFWNQSLQEAGFEALHCWGWQTQDPGSERDRHVTITARRR